MTHNTKKLLLLLTLFIWNTGNSQEVELLHSASKYIEGEDYQSAISEYGKIIEEGFISPELEYNLGTSYLKQKDGANAVLHLRRALQLDPNHTEAQHNLTIARNIVDTEISYIPDFFLLRYWRSFYKLISEIAWVVVGFICLAGVVGAVYFWLFPKSSKMKRMAFSAGIVLTFVTLISILAGYGRYTYGTASNQAVIRSASEFYIGADDRSESLGHLSAGVECIILDRIGEYLKIQLRDKEVGWIQESKITVI